MQHHLMCVFRSVFRRISTSIERTGRTVINKMPYNQEDNSQHDDDKQHKKEEEQWFVIAEELSHCSVFR